MADRNALRKASERRMRQRERLMLFLDAKKRTRRAFPTAAVFRRRPGSVPPPDKDKPGSVRPPSFDTEERRRKAAAAASARAEAERRRQEAALKRKQEAEARRQREAEARKQKEEKKRQQQLAALRQREERRRQLLERMSAEKARKDAARQEQMRRRAAAMAARAAREEELRKKRQELRLEALRRRQAALEEKRAQQQKAAPRPAEPSRPPAAPPKPRELPAAATPAAAPGRGQISTPPTPVAPPAPEPSPKPAPASRRPAVSLSAFAASAASIKAAAAAQIAKSRAVVSKVSAESRKKRVPRPAAAGVPALAKPKEAARPARQAEPLDIKVFVRKNAFRLVCLLLVIALAGELLFFMMAMKPRDERMEEIVGEKPSEQRPAPAAPAAPVQIDVALKPSTVTIEGRRDPFSAGVLTMAVIRQPVRTDISMESKPSVLSILRAPRIVSPGTPVIAKLPEPPPRTPVVKPEMPSVPSLPSVGTPSVLSPGSVTAEPETPRPVVSPIVVAPQKCPLVYRGRMILEGVEYIFLEGEQRTYRVTVGDIVEGYKVLKKEGDRLILSREGAVFEISVQ